MATRHKNSAEAASNDAPEPENEFEYEALKLLSDYSRPSMPADESLRLFWTNARNLFRSSEEKPHIAAEQLEKTTMGLLDDIVAPPSCGPVIEEIELSIAAWCLGDSVPSNFLIVLPPCDENNILEQWALDHGHDILTPPSRQTIASPVTTIVPNLDGEGLLVIPRLEDWFIRNRNGLTLIRKLLAQIDEHPRRIIIGCNSWAWDFLQKSVQADLILPAPQCFIAFNARRLHKWINHMANPDTQRVITFRQSKSGKNVLRLDDVGEPESDFLKTLAARSMGIPWTAWHMWRRALRSDREDEAKAKAEAEELAQQQAEAPLKSSEAAALTENENSGEHKPRAINRRRNFTLWVAEIEELSLPSRYQHDALLALHALLIHGSMSADELRETVPLVGSSYIVASLVSKGFVVRDNDFLRCHPAAYPQIRSALTNAGFPVAAV